MAEARPVQVDMATGEVKSPPDDSAQPFRAWFADRQHQQAFYGWLKRVGLTGEDVHAALKIKSLNDLSETMTRAQVRESIEAYQAKPVFEDERTDEEQGGETT